MSTNEGTARLELFDHRLSAVEHKMDGVVKVVYELRDTMNAMPRRSTYKETVTIIGATVAIMTAFLGIADQWLSSRIATDRQTIQRLAEDGDDLKVLRYRVQLLEQQSKK